MTLFTVSAGNDAITVLIRFSKALVFDISFSCTFLSTMTKDFPKDLGQEKSLASPPQTEEY